MLLPPLSWGLAVASERRCPIVSAVQGNQIERTDYAPVLPLKTSSR